MSAGAGLPDDERAQKIDLGTDVLLDLNDTPLPFYLVLHPRLAPNPRCNNEPLSAYILAADCSACILLQVVEGTRPDFFLCNTHSRTVNILPPVSYIQAACFREQMEAGSFLLEAAKKEKESLHMLLNAKIEELSRKTSECGRLQEKSLALAKELAALKLSADMNLQEEEILKLASLGNHGNLQNVVDVLKRSLAIRNNLLLRKICLGMESKEYNEYSVARVQNKNFHALVWSLDDLIPSNERYIFNFNSKDELKRWHLYSDSEYGGDHFLVLNTDHFKALEEQ